MWGDNAEDAKINEKKICVDVGGVQYTTLNTTLMKSSFFLNMFTTNQDDYIFIDRDPALFYYILNYLRTGKIFLATDDKSFLDSIKNEANFYELDELADMIPKCYTTNQIIEILNELKSARLAPSRPHTRHRANEYGSTPW